MNGPSNLREADSWDARAIFHSGTITSRTLYEAA